MLKPSETFLVSWRQSRAKQVRKHPGVIGIERSWREATEAHRPSTTDECLLLRERRSTPIEQQKKLALPLESWCMGCLSGDKENESIGWEYPQVRSYRRGGE